MWDKIFTIILPLLNQTGPFAFIKHSNYIQKSRYLFFNDLEMLLSPDAILLTPSFASCSLTCLVRMIVIESVK